MSKFVYPRLSRSDIVSIVMDAQIMDISEHHLLNPNPDFVADLYTRILIALDFFNQDFGQVDFDALQQFENPDFHETSLHSINLCNRIKQVLALVDCPYNFTLKDLLRPDPNRTEYFLSAIINYHLYRETKVNLLTELMNPLTEIEEQHQLLQGQISQLNAEIAGFNEAREKELPLLQEVDARVKELRQTIEGLNNDQVKVRTSLKKLKEKSGEMDKEISDADFDLLKCDSERQELRSRIVQSPDKLQRAVEEKKSIREKAKNDEMSAMQSFKEKTAVEEVYTKVLKKLSKHLAQMQAIQEQVNSAKFAGKDYKALKDKISDDEILIKSLQNEVVKRQAKVKDLNDLKRKLEKERDLKFEEATKEYSNVKLEVESRRGVLEARQKDVEAAVAEVDSITAKVASVRKSAAADQQALAHKCEEIIKEFHQYASSIGVLLQ
ncbi:kinetochore protein NUF2 homolog [Rosa rugosa]|uniref:kinetochore protein NUF2 homolog n=1 Tax=Rosa rugosa TaxID=74645 RepID=UPI002B414645|nr:kinetochore protein NUF2 homolog [Rosa rugosa]